MRRLSDYWGISRCLKSKSIYQLLTSLIFKLATNWSYHRPWILKLCGYIHLLNPLFGGTAATWYSIPSIQSALSTQLCRISASFTCMSQFMKVAGSVLYLVVALKMALIIPFKIMPILCCNAAALGQRMQLHTAVPPSQYDLRLERHQWIGIYVHERVCWSTFISIHWWSIDPRCWPKRLKA